MNMLEGKSIVITGAGSGIGRSACQLFAEYGARIVAADVDEAGGAETVELVRGAGGEIDFIRTDVTIENDVKSMVAFAVDRMGQINGAFNNAGIAQSATILHELDASTWQRALDINLTGVFTCIKYQVIQMLAQGSGGSIVNTASTLGQVAIPRGSEYCASKHGVLGLTKGAALDYAASGIRVNAVLPGATQTPMIDRAVANDPGLGDFIAQVHPLGRFGKASEVAEGAAWLLSDAASFVTGTSLNVDGGYVIH